MITRRFTVGLLLAVSLAGCYQSSGKNLAGPPPAGMKDVKFDVPGMS
jgi:hypothetical protein